MSGYIEEHAAQVRRAAERIRGHVRRTPSLGTDLDPHLRLKAECFQVTGSFKPRGAFNALLALVESGRRPKGVIAVSFGNHAQAVALAARTVGVPALILIPEDANPTKVAATRALGAEVIQEGINFANRERRLREVMAERELTLVHPFDDWDVIHGQGTAALELLSDDPELRTVVAPLGVTAAGKPAASRPWPARRLRLRTGCVRQRLGSVRSRSCSARDWWTRS